MIHSGSKPQLRGVWGFRLFWDPAFLTVVLVMVAGLSVLWLLLYAFGPLPLLDLKAYLAGGQAWAHGRDPYQVFLQDPNSRGGIGSGFNYPPNTLPLFGGLALLGMEWVSRLWLGAGLGALAWCLWDLARPRTARNLSCLAIITVLFYPVLTNVALGQVGLFMLAGAWAAFRLADGGQNALGGMSLAASSIFKMFPLALAAALLLRGRWRSVLVAAGTLLASVALTWPWTHAWWPEWLTGILLVKASYATPSPGNQSIAAAFTRTLTANAYQYPLLIAPTLARLLTIAVSLVLLAAVLVSGWRVRHRAGGLDHAMLLAALPLALPIAAEHYYVLALPLFWIVVSDGVRQRDGWLLGAAVLAEVGLSLVPATVDRWYFTVAHMAPAWHGLYANAAVLGALALLGAGMRLAVVRQRTQDLEGSERPLTR